MTFTQRLLTVQLVLGELTSPIPTPAGTPSVTAQVFRGADGQVGNTLTISGHRVGAKISYKGGSELANAEVIIYGMQKQDMLQASTFAHFPAVMRNAQIILYAGTASTGLSMIFSGSIIRAVPDFNGSPEPPFNVTAVSGSSAQMLTIAPTSIKGPQSASSLLRVLAAQAGLSFENNSPDGTNVPIVHPFFDGSCFDQIRDIANAAKLNFIIDAGALAVWPSGSARVTSAPSITLSPKLGNLVGYPTFGTNDITAKCLFDPSIKYGATVTIKDSIVTPANGTWYLYCRDDDLASNWPDGPWFSTLHMVMTASGAP